MNGKERVNLFKVIEKMNLVNLTPDIDVKGIWIHVPEFNRPALQLTGFYDQFDNDRIQIIGNVEYAYLKSLSETERYERYMQLLSSNIPCLIFCRNLEPEAEIIELAKKYDFIYAAVGVHPSDIADLNEETFAWLREQTAWERTVAVGEIGLDYYWDKEPNVQENQRYWFKRQLELAAEASLPVIIHSRDAAQDTMEIMTEAAKKNIRGVIHCYSYSPEMALEYVKLGYYIGVGGVVTFKNAKKLVQTVSELPLDRILLETDCPYMAPEPHRGTRNDSSNIPYVIKKIAEIKGTTPDEVERMTRANAFELFTRVNN